jgi:glycosyltransferase 2 family protein
LNKKTPLWIGIILSGLVIAYVLLKLDWQEVSTTLLSLNWVWIFLAFSVYLLNYLLRTIRFRKLLSLEEIPFHKMFSVTNLYGMYLYLMPAKFGEVTFPVLVKRRLGINISISTGSLIVARIFDFLTIALILPAAVLVYWNIIPVNFKIASAVFCVLVYSFFGIFFWFLRRPDRLLPWLSHNESSNPVISKLKEFISGVYKGAQIVDQGQYWQLILITMGIWICVNLNFYLITLALGYAFNFFQIVVVSIIMVPVTLFPIQGFANLGSHELGWITAFTLFGYPYLDALNIAVSSHIVYVFFVLSLGLIGILSFSDRQNIKK